ncbi:MAG: Holliday junction resolvase RuvX [Candidatus Competibacteraceae bacterium]|nr:MAG: Holliday junction resolvase RuvX [Candidatus Competibacteraceae bacterium]
MPATPDHGLESASAPKPSPVFSSCRVVLGFDYGRLRIGVAIGEALTGSARPLRVLPTRHQRPDWDAIGRLIGEWQPDLLVVGVPRHADDTASATTEAALRFGRQLNGRFQLPVATIDERLSSWEAKQRRFETKSPGRRGGAAAVDAQAAALILESWFNHQRSLDPCATPNS